jgi:hypothetical protein
LWEARLSTQRELRRQRREEHQHSKWKQCHRARRPQLIIPLIVLSIVGGLSPLAVIALKKDEWAG